MNSSLRERVWKTNIADEYCKDWASIEAIRRCCCKTLCLSCLQRSRIIQPLENFKNPHPLPNDREGGQHGLQCFCKGPQFRTRSVCGPKWWNVWVFLLVFCHKLCIFFGILRTFCSIGILGNPAGNPVTTSLGRLRVVGQRTILDECPGKWFKRRTRYAFDKSLKCLKFYGHIC